MFQIALMVRVDDRVIGTNESIKIRGSLKIRGSIKSHESIEGRECIAVRMLPSDLTSDAMMDSQKLRCPSVAATEIGNSIPTETGPERTAFPSYGDCDEGGDRTPGSGPRVLLWVPVPCVEWIVEEPERFAVYAPLPVQEGDVGSTPELAGS
jgi:hypothetical protein